MMTIHVRIRQISLRSVGNFFYLLNGRAASVGLFQNDIEKVIAYSTMSQLAREYNSIIIFRHRTICVNEKSSSKMNVCC